MYRGEANLSGMCKSEEGLSGLSLYLVMRQLLMTQYDTDALFRFFEKDVKSESVISEAVAEGESGGDADHKSSMSMLSLPETADLVQKRGR